MSSLKQHFTSMVQELIPLGAPRRDSVAATPHPVSCSPRIEPSEKTPKLLKPLPNCIQPTKNRELEQRNKTTSAALKASNKRPERDRILSSKVMRKLQPNNGNIYSRQKNGSVNHTVKKDILQRSSSYNKDKELSYALSKELNENLRRGGGSFQPDAMKVQRHSLPYTSHSRHNPESSSSCLFQQRPKASVKTGERITHHPDQKKERLENRDHKTSYCSNMSIKKKSSNPHHKNNPEDRMSLSGKRKKEGSTENEKEMKRPCVDFQPSTSSAKCAFMKGSNEFVITIKEKSHKMLPAAPNSNNKPRLLPYLPSQLFKPCKDSSTASDKPNSFKLTKSPTVAEKKDVMVTHANKNPKAPPSQPHSRKVSPKSSTTFDSIETQLFAPDCCLPSPKTHNKKTNAERETWTQTSLSSNHKESVKIVSSPHHLDLRSPCIAKQAGSCKMETDVRIQLKVEQSRSPKAVMSVPAVSVNVEGSREQKCCPKWKDPLDIELGDDSGDELREHCNISMSSSSSGLEDEPLPSLEKLMSRRDHVPVTPEKDAFSEPNTPVSKAASEAVKTKAVSYRNTLEQMLQEKEQYQRSKELERQLLESCEDDLLNIDEIENSESKEEDISLEQRKFLQRFSVASCAIRDIHPGEEIFLPARFGRLFNHRTLDLRKITMTPHNKSQQIIFKARTEHVLSLISAGLLRKAYFSFPCQPEVTRWLFQMMSVYPNPIISSHIMQSLQTIALSAAQHIVEHQSQSFKVWVPSVRDITLVFLNMGASFISLFPLEALQPPFTEGDLLESFQLEETSQDRVISDMKDNGTLLTHNLESVLNYLSLCTTLCPRAYTDEELVLLLTMVCRIGLETHFQLLPTGHFSILLQNLLKNITRWDEQISKACQTLTDLSEDHHNLRRLVYLLPDSSRGKQLKRHLSVSIISKLLNHTCTYKPSGTEFKLSELKPYLPQMRPSSLLKVLRSAKSAEDCDTNLDQQAYYLCYSLLTLTNEASNFEFLPSAQRDDLQSLSSQLEKHIKCDIRESEKMLYRSKVKDFVARIYTKWQVLLTRSRPQEGKLYDYWKPPPEDEVSSCPQDKSCIKSQDNSESAEETLTEEWSVADSDEDAESKEEDCEEPQLLESEVKIERNDEDCVEDTRDVEEEKDEPKQQMMELEDDRKFELISDEELSETHEDSDCEEPQPLESEVKIEQGDEDCVEDISDVENKKDEPKQQMMELVDDRKFEPISDEELSETHEDSECEEPQPLVSEEKTKQSDEDCVEDISDVEEEKDEPKQQMMELEDDRKFEPISDEELSETHEDSEYEEPQSLESEEKMRRDDEDCVEDIGDVDEETFKPKQQMMEIDDDRKFEPISDEELSETHEDSECEEPQSLESEEKIEQGDEDCVEDISDVEEEKDEPKQPMMELKDDRKFEPISDEELSETHEDSEYEDDEDDLMNREEELLKDEEPHE
ncbi:SMC5-SMC6 complex localization factor protein 2-like isoform X2 [Carassius auratus]|uniref:SMC5-SMC6 complex localization factor protein 2-like isoform X2 n=1 Tax=Carassius auratus TaxID=7957 RepID=A0A6P6L8M6_CARAU|nr:SMC5-SMC6 complex localization factor protein 2-like isoform X2 [Carassius auratus]